ncbi:hypothetical protein SERLA73DRAFT_116291 [Serpula lacrymans var. lacrymans S7.3]|uniref:Conserved oligomeric Golgi complex subunit 1 n=2 Tax=Serpula lacrymans var. lacrymans TaxID=341189 RepID=F8QEY9_SERL3|nr:uncharacterized protein SERLADRAFT_432710 [Serpula lacrymans var. lacrymans S7.9]EGN93152.1 hypothetical protein SERLA73DRAFT_116291 [Serpula lacrymans var. lacrymans S7.3]EGO31048.1 hypothetical protein SERLADRAFT_432710 [Serpula lacrymans var. lacrymans S7.9]
MARRSSAASILSFAPTKNNADVSARQTFSPSTSKAKLPPSSSLLSNTSSKFPDNALHLSPDELYTKHTIPEVKAVQLQLRADAEAKQEELRVMVGERYRDLLQASTSIISISKSSQRVKEALEEIKEITSSQNPSPTPKRASQSSKDDTHLQTLQKLSAHVKLLLDAPEHLWRLIERDKYFHAAWLFLLARVVHRALVQDDGQDEESWINQGINILEQFPLIQRQWDTVSHFRTQIVHKATMSLRIYNRPSEDICATLLTLHLLDSRPLSETLTVFLAQRSKTFGTLLTKTTETPSTSIPAANQHNGQANGHLPQGTVPKSGVKPTKVQVRMIKISIQTAFDVMSRTVNTARDVFQESSEEARHSMIGQVLKHIQFDSSSSTVELSSLPSELLLDTQTLLAGLPSAAQFNLLPANISSYKPYVDLDSASSSVPQALLFQKLDAWFTHAADSSRNALTKWFSGLSTVKDVWSVRTSLRKWLQSDSQLEQKEQLKLKTVMDEAVRHRVTSIWKSVLLEAEEAFCKQLSSVTIIDSVMQECAPLEHLFRTPTLPTFPPAGAGLSTSEATLLTYRSTLRQQLSGRTPYLDSVLSTLEKCSATLQRDFSRITAGDDDRDLAATLREAYRPDAEVFCDKLVNALNLAAEEAMKRSDVDSGIKTLVLISRTASELSLSSPFVSGISCDDLAAEAFRAKTCAVHDRITAFWLDHTVSHAISEYTRLIRLSKLSSSQSPSGPSAALIESLLSLSTGCHSLGLSHEPHLLSKIAQKALVSYCSSFIETTDRGIKTSGLQALYDLTFLSKLSSSWNVKEMNSSPLDSALELLRFKTSSDGSNSLGGDPERAASDHIMRMQVLLSALLSPSTSISPTSKEHGDKLSALLTYGVPVIDASFQSVTELAKPSARFGLLLINTSG